MNDLLRTLLPAVRAAARQTLQPEDLDTVIVHNTGAIPPLRSDGGTQASAPGFNVIVAKRGRPVYFCKCRPAGDGVLGHEFAVGEILARTPSIAAHVAAPHLHRGDVMDVLVLPRLPGKPYYEVLVGESEKEWMASVQRVAHLVAAMAAPVRDALPALRRTDAVRLEQEAAWALEALVADHGLSPRRTSALVDALAAAGPVEASLQHGDLWPPNVLIDGSDVYILDFELFGRVRVPLYDLLHMLHICSDVRRRASVDARPWAERFVVGDRAEAAPRRLFRSMATLAHMSPEAALGAIVFYTVDVAARVKARGAWTADWREYVEQVERLADLLDDGTATPRSVTTDRE